MGINEEWGTDKGTGIDMSATHLCLHHKTYNFVQLIFASALSPKNLKEKRWPGLGRQVSNDCVSSTHMFKLTLTLAPCFSDHQVLVLP